MLIDIHTHSESVQNHNHLRFVVGKHSLGIHPWELVAPFDMELYALKFGELKNLFSPKVLAIGECGFDRRRADIAPVDIQETIFKWHMDWAMKEKRPLVVHCVKAYSDLLKMLKSAHYAGKILLHDFGGSLEEANKLLDYDSYFSFGHRLIHPNDKRLETLRGLPKDRLFLETDGQTDIGIVEIYTKAGDLLNLNQKQLEVQFEKNLADFFSNLDNVSTADVIDYLRHP